MVSEIHTNTNNQWRKLKFVHKIAFSRKTKTRQKPQVWWIQDNVQKLQRKCTFMNSISAEQSHIMQASVVLLHKVHPSARDCESDSAGSKNSFWIESSIQYFSWCTLTLKKVISVIHLQLQTRRLTFVYLSVYCLLCSSVKEVKRRLLLKDRKQLHSLAIK